MHAARDIQTRFQGLDDMTVPCFREHTAGVHGADDERPGAAMRGLGNREFGNAEIGPATGKPHLSRDSFRAPVDDALSGLGRQRVPGGARLP